MVIVYRKDIENSVWFPRNTYTRNNGKYSLEVTDRATNRSWTFSDLEDKGLAGYDFYTFFIKFNELPKGEYEYRITDSNGDKVGTGIIRMEYLESDSVEYNQERTYVAYHAG